MDVENASQASFGIHRFDLYTSIYSTCDPQNSLEQMVLFIRVFSPKTSDTLTMPCPMFSAVSWNDHHPNPWLETHSVTIYLKFTFSMCIMLFEAMAILIKWICVDYLAGASGRFWLGPFEESIDS